MKKNKNLNRILLPFLSGILIIAISIVYIFYKRGRGELTTFLLICYCVTSFVGFICIVEGFNLIYKLKKNIKVINKGDIVVGEYISHVDEKNSGNYLDQNLMYTVTYKYEHEGHEFIGRIKGLTIEEALVLRIIKNFKVKCIGKYSYIDENVRVLTLSYLDKIRELKNNYINAMKK